MILEKVKEIIVEQAGVDVEEVTENTHLINDLEVDSLEVFEIVMAIEEEYGLEIPNEDIEQMKTVKEAVAYIQSKTA